MNGKSYDEVNCHRNVLAICELSLLYDEKHEFHKDPSCCSHYKWVKRMEEANGEDG